MSHPKEVGLHWKHRTAVTFSRGRIRVTCGCGAQTGWFSNEDDARKWTNKHVGVKETKPIRDDV